MSDELEQLENFIHYRREMASLDHTVRGACHYAEASAILDKVIVLRQELADA